MYKQLAFSHSCPLRSPISNALLTARCPPTTTRASGSFDDQPDLLRWSRRRPARLSPQRTHSQNARRLRPSGQHSRADALSAGRAPLLQGELAPWRPDIPHEQPFCVAFDNGVAASVCASVRKESPCSRGGRGNGDRSATPRAGLRDTKRLGPQGSGPPAAGALQHELGELSVAARGNETGRCLLRSRDQYSVSA